LLQPEGKILVIDDERDMVAILKKYLTDAGYQVSLPGNVMESAAEAARILPDLILMDVKMPFKDGYQIKAELNQNEKTADIPVIFLSSSVSDLDRKKGAALKADCYVTKPLDIKDLLAKVSAALKRSGPVAEST